MLITRAPMLDPAFPKLDAALDRNAAAQAFATALAKAGYATGHLDCSIERCRVKRGRKAVIGYRLRGQAIDGRFIDQQCMVALYPDGDDTRLPRIARSEAMVAPAFGPAALEVDAFAGRAWFFPNDRKISGIAKMLRARTGDAEIVHYVPEQGCTIRLTQSDGTILYGKCRADDRGAVAAKASACAAGCKGVRLARIVDHDPLNRILWQEAVAGTPLDPAETIRHPKLWAARIATALAAFHACPAPELKQLTYESINATLARRIDRMTGNLSDLAPRLAAIATRFAQARPSPGNLVLTHGDLHAGNLLWDGTSFALIDLDTAALAPPALDHATLAANLVHKAIEADADAASIAELIDQLRHAANAEIANDRAFDWCLAASLVGDRLYRCTTRLKSPRAHVRERLFALADQLVEYHA